jgi:NIPSNAP
LKAGTQLPRLHEYFAKTLVPKIAGLWSGPKIFLEALIAPHMPQIVVIYGFGSLDELWSVHGKSLADPDLMKAYDALDSGPEPSFETLDTTLLEAAPYSPEIAAVPDGKARIFELRVYHSPTFRQLTALHERFSGPEIEIFHRVGIHPILYCSTLIGPNIPNLTYLIPFENLAAREKDWTAFAADPESRCGRNRSSAPGRSARCRTSRCGKLPITRQSSNTRRNPLRPPVCTAARSSTPDAVVMVLALGTTAQDRPDPKLRCGCIRSHRTGMRGRRGRSRRSIVTPARN